MVIDLKMRAFEPDFAGKMNFCLSAVNDLLRHPDDEPSIGLILCKTNDRFGAEYSLRDINKPIGMSKYRLAESLPEKLKGGLSTIKNLENQLGTQRRAQGVNNGRSIGSRLDVVVTEAKAIDRSFDPATSIRALQYYGDGTLDRVSENMRRDLTRWAQQIDPATLSVLRSRRGLSPGGMEL